MSKRLRPSLKDYLKTGEVRTGKETPPEPSLGETRTDAGEPAPSPLSHPPALLELLAPSDRQMWGPILHAGTETQVLPLDPASLREDFRTMDRSRYTYYVLEQKGKPLQPVRTEAQIRGSLALVLKWDEVGSLTLYDPDRGAETR
jgi:hypothetical protein